MGVLTDLVIGTESDLASVPEGEVPINVLPGVDVKGTGLVAIAVLHEIVCGGEVDPSLAAFPFVGGESEGGRWLNRLPDDLVAQLACLDDVGVQRSCL